MDNVEGVYRFEPAPLACASDNGVDFQKFSTPGALLNMMKDNVDTVHIVTDCTVRRIVRQVRMCAYEWTLHVRNRI